MPHSESSTIGSGTEGSTLSTLVYSPQIRVRIASHMDGGSIIDVSEDLVQGTLNIRTNGVHTFHFQLQNPQRKYDRALQPMDRIVVEMKRIAWVRVFSGYLNNGPIFSAWPRVLDISASCTLKRLQFWFWDPSSDASKTLLDALLGPARQSPAALMSTQAAAAAGGAAGGATAGAGAATGATADPSLSSFDADISAAVVQILVNVVRWPQEKIHIAAFPGGWEAFADSMAQVAAQAAQASTGIFGDFTSIIGFGGTAAQGTAGAATGAAAGAAAGGASPAGATAAGGATADPSTGGVIAGTPLATNGALQAGTYGGVQLNAAQASTAAQIYNIAKSRGLSNQAASIAIATAMQESTLRNINFGDRDSVGVFQQRPSQGWGSPAQLTDVTYATNAFFDALVKVPNYQTLSLTQAAQAVQRSAFPNAYARWEALARATVASLSGASPGAATPAGAAGTGTAAAGGAGAGAGTATAAGAGAAAGAVGAAGAAGAASGAGGAADAAAAAAAAGLISPQVAQAYQSLVSIYSWGLQPSMDPLGHLLEGSRAMMNDQPILPFIANLMSGTMRSWCSAPNGDFIAWFPDYFGIWNTAAVMNIRQIELMDFTVDWFDQEIVTHQYVVGSPMAMLNAADGSFSGVPDSSGFNWLLSTNGIATMDNPQIFQALFGEAASAQFVAEYLYRFGGRPNMVNMPQVVQGKPEFFMALYLFMQRWANQFRANVPMTFMPELWPGMLLALPDYEFQAYIMEVQHSFKFGKGGGFHTSAKICAPARTSAKTDIFGLLPLAGSAR
jgi:hypothetical protein